jgi:hypothetical protein
MASFGAKGSATTLEAVSKRIVHLLRGAYLGQSQLLFNEKPIQATYITSANDCDGSRPTLGSEPQSVEHERYFARAGSISTLAKGERGEADR